MMATVLVLACAGGAGAGLRLVVNRVVHKNVSTTYPVAMLIINISGAFVLGLVTGVADAHLLPAHIATYLTVGLVGGFTAFSTTSFQTLRLIQERRYWLAAINSIGMLAAAVAVAGVGTWIGRMI